jgi:kumamolisin
MSFCHTYYKLQDAATRDGARPAAFGPTFTPPQLATLYNFPAGDGTGQKIGIIELGGGYLLSDIQTYFNQLGIVGVPNVVAVGVDGAVNNPSDTSGANIEVVLDIEVIIAIVPKAQIRVYFGPNSWTGFYNAINRAKNDGCGIISISWGAPEVQWGSTNLANYNSLFQACADAGITVTAASGDNGSSDGLIGNNADFPCSSPYVIACGGTTLTAANATTITSEVVWNNHTGATGGGVSAFFAKPTYQNNIGSISTRGVPDISGVADPNTGYRCYSAEYGSFVVGGTSAVSPLWAALTARINQNLGVNTNGNQLHSAIYTTNPSCCRDVVSGNNGAFSASLGWDRCTGFGSPNGQLVQSAVQTTSSQPVPPPVLNPVARFSAAPTGGTGNTLVTFTNQSTNAVSYLWTFGDGSPTSTSANPTHTYAPGTYSVSLRATNSQGATNTLTKTNHIKINAVKPIAAFTASPLTTTVTSSKAKVNVQFTNNSTGATSYLWVFGDGTTSTAAAPLKKYGIGKYSVKLTVRNGASSATMTRTNYITVKR